MLIHLGYRTSITYQKKNKIFVRSLLSNPTQLTKLTIYSQYQKKNNQIKTPRSSGYFRLFVPILSPKKILLYIHIIS